ncbi:MAG: hypothetical protein N3D16_08915 [Anaerolineales bacterium]|nr:hypothetical protein [Anaerolineales bacterium]
MIRFGESSVELLIQRTKKSYGAGQIGLLGVAAKSLLGKMAVKSKDVFKLTQAYDLKACAIDQTQIAFVIHHQHPKFHIMGYL